MQCWHAWVISCECRFFTIVNRPRDTDTRCCHLSARSTGRWLVRLQVPLLTLYFRAEVVDSDSRFHFLSEKPRALISAQSRFHVVRYHAIYRWGSHGDIHFGYVSLKKWCCFIQARSIVLFSVIKIKGLSVPFDWKKDFTIKFISKLNNELSFYHYYMHWSAYNNNFYYMHWSAYIYNKILISHFLLFLFANMFR